MPPARRRDRGTGSVVGRALFGLACCVVLGLTFILGVLVGRQWARSTPPLDDADAELGSAGGRSDWVDGDRRWRRFAADTGGDSRVPSGVDAAAEAAQFEHGAGGASTERERPGARVAAGAPGRAEGRETAPWARALARADSLETRAARDDAARPGPEASPGVRTFEDGTAAQIQEKLTFFHTLRAPLAAGPPPAPQPRSRPAPAAIRAPSRPREPLPARELFTVQVAAVTTRAQAEALRARLGDTAYVVEADGVAPGRYRVRVGTFGSRAEADATAARLRADHSLTPFVTTR
jgi:cell division septation protein DedD